METTRARFEEVPVDAIERPAVVLRGHADEARLEELRLSIRKRGVLVPVIVAEADGGYRLIAGLRRLLCAAANGLATIPAMIVASNEEWEAWATVAENELREGINAVDQATYIAAVMERRGLSGSQAAAMFDRSESWVSQRLGILRWPEDVRESVRQGWVSFAAGREIAGIGSETARAFCLGQARRLGCSVRQAESWRRNWSKEQAGPAAGLDVEGDGDLAESPRGLQGCIFCERSVQAHLGMIVFACSECLSVIHSELNQADRG